MSTWINQDIVRMFEAGVATERIADELEIPRGHIVRVLLRTGKSEEDLKTDAERKAVGPESRKRILQSYEAGIPMGRTCKLLGVKPWEYWKVLDEEGVPLLEHAVDKALSRARRDDEICSLYKQEVVVTRIMVMCGVSRDTVYRVLYERGVPLRRS